MKFLTYCCADRFIVLNQPPLGDFPLFKPPFVPASASPGVQVKYQAAACLCHVLLPHASLLGGEDSHSQCLHPSWCHQMLPSFLIMATHTGTDVCGSQFDINAFEETMQERELHILVCGRVTLWLTSLDSWTRCCVLDAADFLLGC